MGDRTDFWQGTLALMLTRAGRKQLQRETRDWEKATEILARFLAPSEDPA